MSVPFWELRVAESKGNRVTYGSQEDILVHELVHLLERTHNARFIAHMDKLMPDWRHRRDELNRLPVPHEDWEY